MKAFKDMSQQERDMVIRMLLSEAGNQGSLGMQAVAAVIGNRADQSRLSPGQVITQKSQFEPYGTPAGRRKLDSYSPDDPKYQQAASALDHIASGGRDPTGGADHFWSPKAQAAMRRRPPKWATSPGQAIGDHQFHRLGYAAAQPPAAPAPPAAPQPPPAPAIPAAEPGILSGSRYDDGTSEGYFNPQDPRGARPAPDSAPPAPADPVVEAVKSLGLAPTEEKKLLAELLGQFPGKGGFEGFGYGGVG